mgnify:CR=1 FL=1
MRNSTGSTHTAANCILPANKNQKNTLVFALMMLRFDRINYHHIG